MKLDCIFVLADTRLLEKHKICFKGRFMHTLSNCKSILQFRRRWNILARCYLPILAMAEKDRCWCCSKASIISHAYKGTCLALQGNVYKGGISYMLLCSALLLYFSMLHLTCILFHFPMSDKSYGICSRFFGEVDG